MKRCTKCGNEYPLTAEFWHKSGDSVDGFKARCRSCRNQDNRAYEARNYEKVSERKRLWQKNNPDKTNATSLRWARANPEKRKAIDARYYLNNKDKVRDRGRLYAQNNPEWKREQNKKAYRKNRGNIKEGAKRWRRQNIVRVTEYSLRYRARKRNAEGTFTESEVWALFREQEGYCFHCGCDLIPIGFHRDHWIPLTRGGSNWISNIRMLCAPCNLSKHDKLPHEWCPEKYSPEQK